jgi:hypothetical protein
MARMSVPFILVSLVVAQSGCGLGRVCCPCTPSNCAPACSVQTYQDEETKVIASVQTYQAEETKVIASVRTYQGEETKDGVEGINSLRSASVDFSVAAAHSANPNSYPSY